MVGGLSVSAADNQAIYSLQKSSVDGNDVFLNGMGAAKKLNADYYIAALYLQTKSGIDTDIIFLNTPKRLEIKFLLERVSARSFGRELATALKINNDPSELGAYRRELRELIGLFRGIYKQGDKLQFDIMPGKSVSIRYNGDLLGRFRTKGFDKVLMKAWLGQKPSSTAFKAGLVGNNDDETAVALLKRYVDS
nr:chalcone isomerase family protein [Pleionea sp. CnH1-48]